MNQEALVSVLHAASGVDPKLLAESVNQYLTYGREKRVADALAGKPAQFAVGGRSLGRCYAQYETVTVNYTGADDEKPNGMCGKVPPSKTGVCDGVAWAYFVYSIDSGD
jgi:hypothetical protein